MADASSKPIVRVEIVSDGSTITTRANTTNAELVALLEAAKFLTLQSSMTSAPVAASMPDEAGGPRASSSIVARSTLGRRVA